MTKFAQFFNGKRSENASQAKKKKKLSKIGMCVCAAVILLSFILIAVLSVTVNFNSSGIFTPIVIIAFLVLLYFWLKLNCARKELFTLNNLYCSKCGEKFSLNNVTFEEINSKSISSKSNDEIKLDTYTVAAINCKCEKCGNTHSFNYDFLTERKRTNLLGATISSQTYTLDDRIKEFFNF